MLGHKILAGSKQLEQVIEDRNYAYNLDIHVLDFFAAKDD